MENYQRVAEKRECVHVSRAMSQNGRPVDVAPVVLSIRGFGMSMYEVMLLGEDICIK